MKDGLELYTIYVNINNIIDSYINNKPNNNLILDTNFAKLVLNNRRYLTRTATSVAVYFFCVSDRRDKTNANKVIIKFDNGYKVMSIDNNKLVYTKA